MKFTYIQLVELKIAVEQRIEMLEQRVHGVPPLDMPYSHKALTDAGENLGIVNQAFRAGDYLL